MRTPYGTAAQAHRLLTHWRQQLRRFASSWLALGSVKQGTRARDEWSIGIYRGPSPLGLAPDQAVRNPVLTRWEVTDRTARFVADPFMLRAGDTWYMFFEVLSRSERKGEIGLATSKTGLRWRYQQIVLAEAFHLSYPYVFEWEGSHYLIPESHKDGTIRLYHARRFPYEWAHVGNLLSGRHFADASIFRHADRWWLLTETSPDGHFDTLRLYMAIDLLGPWQEHPHSPLIVGDRRLARPAGRVISDGGALFRFAQDCREAYGTQVYALQITELTPTRYQEVEVAMPPLLAPSGDGWNASGMHHIDPHPYPDGGWIACVDGRVRIPQAAAAVRG